MTQKAHSRALSALFCLFLTGLLSWHLALPDRDRSPVENRMLAQWPEFSWETLRSGEFTQEVEEYFADQFPLRDQWTGLRARMEQLLGKRDFHGVYLCGDRLIARVDPPEEGRLEKNLSSLRRLAEKTEGIPVTLAVIPTAAEIWRDKLPAGAESWDQTLLQRAAEETGFPAADLYSALADHAGEEIFYRTDHHWTTLGAYYGYAALMEALGRGEEVLGREAFQRQAYPPADQFCGTLYSQSGVHWLTPDTMEFWVEEDGLSVTSWREGVPKEASLYDWTYLEEKDKYSAFLGGNQPLCVIKNENLPQGEKLLLLRDSYADALAPFLAQHFAEVHLMDLRYYRDVPARYGSENGIDQILALYSAANFITDRNLELAAR